MTGLIHAIVILAAAAGWWMALSLSGRRLIAGGAMLVHRLERKRLAAAVAFLLALAIGALPWLLGNVAPPSFHDEFAYLLGADTFAHGRLTNPTPKFAEHFETFHEIVQPTYQSKFPPGQSIALFIGQMLGAPIIGAFASVAIASAAGYWMLRAAVPPRWAMIGSLLTVVHPLIFPWAQMYWGGGVPLVGSMLLVGGVIRIARRDRRWFPSLAIGIAVGIFLNTRVLEGGITCAIAFFWLAIAKLKSRQLPSLLRTGVIALLPLIPIIAWMGYYNWRVTGNITQLPYLLHTQQYMRAPLFTWENELPRKSYADERMRQFHEEYEVDEWRKARDNYASDAARKLHEYYAAFGGHVLILLILVLPLALRRSWIARLCLLVAILFPILQIGISVYFRPHYAAPTMGFVILLITLLLREWTRIRWRNLPIGRVLASTIILILFGFAGANLWTSYGNDNPRGATRQRMIERLEREGGKHLILVEYTPRPQLLFEWVYNSAEIDSQRVIWARSLGEMKDRALLDHYKDRRLWKLRVDYNEVSPLTPLD